MVLCESFHRVSRAWPGHYNVWMHRALSLFTAAATMRHSTPPAALWWAILCSAFVVANTLYEYARLMDCGIVVVTSAAAESATLDAPVCAVCRVPVRERMFHCRLCNVCTDRFDHHCAWLNRCVARRNFLPFVAMLAAEIVYLGTGGLMLYKFAYESWIEQGFATCVELVLAEAVFVVFWIAVAALLASAASRISQNKTTYELVKKPAYIATSNRFDLGVGANWSAFFDRYEHEATLYKKLKADTDTTADDSRSRGGDVDSSILHAV